MIAFASIVSKDVVSIGNFIKRINFQPCFLYKVQAERGFAKEASVYFPYLDSVLFRTVHYATLPFCHSTISPFCHSAIPPFLHSTIPSSRHSAILPFCHSAIPPFRHSAPICNNVMYVSQEVLRKVVTLTGGLRSNRYVPPLQAK